MTCLPMCHTHRCLFSLGNPNLVSLIISKSLMMKKMNDKSPIILENISSSHVKTMLLSRVIKTCQDLNVMCGHTNNLKRKPIVSICRVGYIYHEHVWVPKR